jgi:hypothetical protein
MSVAATANMASAANSMTETEVYRPVPATQLESSVYLIDPRAPYNTADETWEFPPGSRVVVIKKVLSGETKLVAVRLYL